ncbi:hypothetical protein [Alkalihalobacillus sp. AL-G]|uniref:hypothetical protein n=1 Tax=Alkalihalobacillus sp. AL-G TaxID=2926399 RepID=UPI00272B3A4A|nr:hypothetical protein [Alkalihalobacillus sp. AL-G]WLD93423.1 hypothetical protein MOJ78_00175 [Alkalihalobacillus sp. AL-G]
MKKILAFTMLFLLVFTAACGSNEDNTTGSKQEGEPTEENTAETKTALMEFQVKVVDVLQQQNKPFAAFESSKLKANDPEAAAEEKPSKEELQSLMETAKAAGPKAAEAIRAIEVPAELEQYKKDIEAALEDAAKSYEKRAESLAIEAAENAQKEADELFASFEKKMGKVFEDLGLLAPSFSKELQ